MKKFTRGHGLLENYLAQKRALQADKLIPDFLRAGKILDIGCGAQPFFLRKIEFREKFGIDQNTNGNEYAGITLYKKNFLENSLLFATNSFNVVTMLAVIEHLDEDSAIKTLKETYRILKADGLLILTTPAGKTADRILRLMVKFGLVSFEEISDHKQIYNPEKIKKHLKNAGFAAGDIMLGNFNCGCVLAARAIKRQPSSNLS